MNPESLQPFFEEAEKVNKEKGDMFQWEKPLVTELDYWSAIETIGSYRHSTEHGYMKGHLDTEGNGTSVLLSSARAYLQQKRLVAALEEKFGIVAPQNCPHLTFEQRMAGEKMPDAPQGMRWYWDWYEATKEEWEKAEYKKEICSACPYSKGPAGNTYVNCSLFSGCASGLHPNNASCLVIQRPHGSGMDCDYSEDEFFEKMKEDHGPEALQKWDQHRDDIRQTL